MWRDMNHSDCKWLQFLCALGGGQGIWFFFFFTNYFFSSMRKILRMFAIALFYFAKVTLDCEFALCAYPASLGEMKFHPPPLWDCPHSEDGGWPLPTLFPCAFRKSCCYSVLWKGWFRVILWLCPLCFLKNLSQANIITGKPLHLSPSDIFLMASVKRQRIE